MSEFWATSYIIFGGKFLYHYSPKRTTVSIMVYYKRSKIDNYRVGICWSTDHIQGSKEFCAPCDVGADWLDSSHLETYLLTFKFLAQSSPILPSGREIRPGPCQGRGDTERAGRGEICFNQHQPSQAEAITEIYLCQGSVKSQQSQHVFI